MTSEISLRKARVEDLPQIVAVDREAFGEHAYGPFILRQYFDITQNFFYVAVADNYIVGYCIGAVSAGDTAGWIVSLGVSASARGKGIGEKLTVEIIKELSKVGATKILLTVEPRNTGAIRLYEKLGFVEQGVEEDYFGAGEDRLVMSHS